jgi:hypothetical protein
MRPRPRSQGRLSRVVDLEQFDMSSIQLAERLVEEGVVAAETSGEIRVFVEDAGRVRAVSAAFGEARDGRRAVLSGLTAGQRVCLAPPSDLGDGAEVDVADS